MNKVINLSQLRRIVASLRRKKKVVFTNGCFDILHPGHLQYLQKAREQGDILIVGLNSDASVRRIKGRARPIFSQKDRARLLSFLPCVDFIVIFNEDTPCRLIKTLRPHILVKGADWKGREVVGADLVKSWKGKVKLVSHLKGYSTTRIIERIKRLCKR